MAKKAAKKTADTVKVTLVVSPIGFNKTQAATVQGLGLRRLRHSVEVVDSAGMRHEVVLRRFAGKAASTASARR